MEFFDSKIKQFLKMKPCTFSAQAQKIKKYPPRKKFRMLQETEAPKIFLIFTQKKAYVSGKGNPEKTPYVLGNFLYFK